MKTSLLAAAVVSALSLVCMGTSTRYHSRMMMKCLPYNTKCTNTYKGCGVYKGICRCRRAVFCCENPFKYKKLSSCLAHNKPRDPCKPNPCYNGGYCAQVNTTEYRCMCHGTGFFGQRCHQKCQWNQRNFLKLMKTTWTQKNRTKMRQMFACLKF